MNSNAGVGKPRTILEVRTPECGRTVIAADQKHTSQRCRPSGHTDAGNRLSQYLVVELADALRDTLAAVVDACGCTLCGEPGENH